MKSEACLCERRLLGGRDISLPTSQTQFFGAVVAEGEDIRTQVFVIGFASEASRIYSARQRRTEGIGLHGGDFARRIGNADRSDGVIVKLVLVVEKITACFVGADRALKAAQTFLSVLGQIRLAQAHRQECLFHGDAITFATTNSGFYRRQRLSW